MANPNDQDQQAIVVDLIDDPIVTDAEAPLWCAVHAGELLNAAGPRFDLEGVELADDPPLGIWAELRELASRRWSEVDAKSSAGHTSTPLQAEFALDLFEGHGRSVLELLERLLRHP